MSIALRGKVQIGSYVELNLVKSSRRHLVLYAPAFCAGFPVLLGITIEHMAFAQHGSGLYLMAQPLLSLPLLAAVPVFFMALIGLAFQRFRYLATIFLLCSTTYLVGFFASAHLGERVRMRAFHRLTERCTPLIHAIGAFEEKYRRPPESLEELVPEFIPSVPRTLVGASSEFLYYFPAITDYGNPWIIKVFVPSGRFEMDQLVYFPLGNYPHTDWYGAPVRFVGDWAFMQRFPRTSRAGGIPKLSESLRKAAD